MDPNETKHDERQYEPMREVVQPNNHQNGHTQNSTIEATNNYSAGMLILQWLVYAFWGWTLLSLSILTGVVINYYVKDTNSSDISEAIAYPLAAVIVLFVISIVCDVFFARKEGSLAKKGAATIIMVIHSVIFALFAIGAVITAVFSVVNLLIGGSDSSDTSGTLSLLFTAIIIAVLYAATLLRTLRPKKFAFVTIGYWVIMSVTILVMTTLAIAGPLVYAHKTQNDRLIEKGLIDVSYKINDYATRNDKLPENLSVIEEDLNGDAAKIIEKNLVEYTPNPRLSAPSTNESASNDLLIPLPTEPKDKVFTYSLCVTYAAEKGSPYNSPYGRTGDINNGANPTTPDTFYHKKGRVCYDLQNVYSYSPQRF